MSESTPPEPPNDDSAPTPPPPPPIPGGAPSAPTPPPSYSGYAAYQPPPGANDPQPSGDYSIGNAVGIGFRVFGAHVGPFVLMVLLIAVVEIVFGGLGFVVGRHHGASGGVHLGNGLPSDLLQLLGTIGITLLTAGLIKGALDAVDGRPVSLTTMFEGWDKAQVVLAAVLVSVVEFIGLLLLVIPGLIAAFLLYFTNFSIVDEQTSATDGMKRSVSFAGHHVGILLLTAIVAALINIVGALLLGVGLFVSLPVTMVMGACAWRQLQGRPVAAA